MSRNSIKKIDNPFDRTALSALALQEIDSSKHSYNRISNLIDFAMLKQNYGTVQDELALRIKDAIFSDTKLVDCLKLCLLDKVFKNGLFTLEELKNISKDYTKLRIDESNNNSYYKESNLNALVLYRWYVETQNIEELLAPVTEQIQAGSNIEIMASRLLGQATTLAFAGAPLDELFDIVLNNILEPKLRGICLMLKTFLALEQNQIEEADKTRLEIFQSGPEYRSTYILATIMFASSVHAVTKDGIGYFYEITEVLKDGEESDGRKALARLVLFQMSEVGLQSVGERFYESLYDDLETLREDLPAISESGGNVEQVPTPNIDSLPVHETFDMNPTNVEEIAKLFLNPDWNLNLKDSLLWLRDYLSSHNISPLRKDEMYMFSIILAEKMNTFSLTEELKTMRDKIEMSNEEQVWKLRYKGTDISLGTFSPDFTRYEVNEYLDSKVADIAIFASEVLNRWGYLDEAIGLVDSYTPANDKHMYYALTFFKHCLDNNDLIGVKKCLDWMIDFKPRYSIESTIIEIIQKLDADREAPPIRGIVISNDEMRGRMIKWKQWLEFAIE